MKILFIGGTKFVGRNIAEMALQQGHQVHILQRGKTNQNALAEATKYFGDRKQIHEVIPENERFDIVIDTCGYHPEVVKKSCSYLENKTDKYIFISTGSVYADFSQVGLNENSQTQSSTQIPDIDSPITGENYGLLKAMCENVVEKYFPKSRRLILRPCIIVGKYDDTNRFNYWIEKIKNSKSLDIPNDEEAFIQFIDVRAIADFVLNPDDKSSQTLARSQA